MPRSKQLGVKLRSLRQRSRLGLKSVAPMVDVSYSHLSKVENGIKPPSEHLLKKLCIVYGVDPEEFVPMIGRLPEDIQRIVESHWKEVFELLRNNYRGL